ncbi:hypothetical protein J6590_027153 [Homalodisca vitripennis]|nr:hypothetical protein J6590_027153 [Homalodisca vitripennis]
MKTIASQCHYTTLIHTETVEASGIVSSPCSLLSKLCPTHPDSRRPLTQTWSKPPSPTLPAVGREILCANERTSPMVIRTLINGRTHGSTLYDIYVNNIRATPRLNINLEMRVSWCHNGLTVASALQLAVLGGCTAHVRLSLSKAY